MKKSYSEKIVESLKLNNPSLKILLEKEGEKEKDSEDSQSDEEDFSFGEKEKDSEDSQSDEEEKDSEDSQSIDKESLNSLTDSLSFMKSFFEEKTTENQQSGGVSSVESYISSAVASGLDQDSLRKLESKITSSIGRFLFEKDQSLENIEADIDDLDRVLTKGTELVDKFKKGKNLNIESYVSAAINAYRNFDNLFSKELIVKQATINVLILNSGAKAENSVSEFEELFHEELHKQFGIEYPEHALISKPHNSAAGAKSQS